MCVVSQKPGLMLLLISFVSPTSQSLFKFIIEMVGSVNSGVINRGIK